MQHYTFTCNCGQTMAVTEDQAEQAARCPSCGTRFTVPRPSAGRSVPGVPGRTVTLQQRAADYLDTLMRQSRAAGVLDDIRNMDFKAEVLPLTHHTFALLRCTSCVFGHAMYSGIFAYFLALGWITQRRVWALAVVGLAVAATVHGLYDWFWGVQATLPALITAVGFVLFYAYLTKLRLVMASIEARLR